MSNRDWGGCENQQGGEKGRANSTEGNQTKKGAGEIGNVGEEGGGSAGRGDKRTTCGIRAATLDRNSLPNFMVERGGAAAGRASESRRSARGGREGDERGGTHIAAFTDAPSVKTGWMCRRAGGCGERRASERR